VLMNRSRPTLPSSAGTTTGMTLLRYAPAGKHYAACNSNLNNILIYGDSVVVTTARGVGLPAGAH
jgi:hypothetical protein